MPGSGSSSAQRTNRDCPAEKQAAAESEPAMEPTTTRLEPFISRGIIELKKANITGKKFTPRLLSFLVQKTNGETLHSNIELVKNNAILGAKVAKALSAA